MPGNLCEHCTGVCCRYIALPIETPETKAEFDDVRWYLLHERVSVFVEDGDWYISLATPCRHLRADNGCGIYATRPRICRRYSTEQCDYHSGDYGWEQHFTCPEHLDEHVRKVFSTNRNGRTSKNSRITADSKIVSKRARRSQSERTSRIGNIKKREDNKGRRPRGRSRRGPPGAGARLAAAKTDIAGRPLPALGDDR